MIAPILQGLLSPAAVTLKAVGRLVKVAVSCPAVGGTTTLEEMGLVPRLPEGDAKKPREVDDGVDKGDVDQIEEDEGVTNEQEESLGTYVGDNGTGYKDPCNKLWYIISLDMAGQCLIADTRSVCETSEPTDVVVERKE